MTRGGLATTWRIELEVLSPLHVGAGGPPLLADWDFVADRGRAWVLDVARALEALPDERIAAAIDGPVGPLLRREQYPAVSRYGLTRRDDAAPAEILPCVRDVFERPYLPGSSLKGALRTVAAAVLLSRNREAFALERLGGRPEWAAAGLERALFGADPNHDLMRGLRVSDCFVDGADEAELAAVSLYTLRPDGLQPKGPGFRWHVEALPVGTRLWGTIALDEHALGPLGPGLQAHRPLLNNLPAHSRRFTATLAGREQTFYARGRLPGPAGFYQHLAARAAAPGAGEGLLQMAWGTGWTAKTVAISLAAEERSAVVRRYGLDRERNAAQFPKTRRLVERGGAPELPLGWVRFRLEREE